MQSQWVGQAVGGAVSAVGEEPHWEGPDYLCMDREEGLVKEGGVGGAECVPTTVKGDVQWGGVPLSIGRGRHELSAVEAVLKDIWGEGQLGKWAGHGEGVQRVHRPCLGSKSCAVLLSSSRCLFRSAWGK